MWRNGSVCLHVCRSYWKIPTLYAFYVVLARTHIAELGSNMAEMLWTIKSMAGKGGMSSSVTMATEWQREKMVRLKAFSADAILTHRVGFLDAPPSKPQFQSKAMHPPTNSKTPIHYFYLNPPSCIRPFTDLQNFYTCRTPGLFDKVQVTIMELWIIIYWLWSTRTN